MTRFGSLIFCATLGAGLLACGSNGDGGSGAGGTSGTGGTSGAGGTLGTGGTSGTGGISGTGGTSGTDTSAKDPLDLVPVDGTVSGWTVDVEHNKGGSAEPMTGATAQEAEALIDGAAAPFYKAPYTPKEFIWQNYVNNVLPAAPQGSYVVIYILQMPSADQASGLYAALLQESEYTGHDWQPTSPPLGTESRIEDTVTAWWINFHQDVFYVEVMLTPSYGPPPDYTISDPDLKQEALRFAQAIASKI